MGVCSFFTSTATQFVLAMNGTVVAQGTPKTHQQQVYPFNTGDYVGLLKSPFGSLAVYSLTDGLVLETDGLGYQVGIKSLQPLLKAGSTLHANLLFVGMHRAVADPVAMAAGIRREYGLVGQPGYRAEVKQGTVLDQQYVFHVQADASGIFQATLHGLAALDGNLGSMVSGLHDNWTAAFQQISGNRVKTRLVPVEQGIGYALWQAEDDGTLVTIGHPFVASNPAITLTLTRSADWKSWQLEIHNPTAKALTVTVHNNPAFTGFTFEQSCACIPAVRCCGISGRWWK